MQSDAVLKNWVSMLSLPVGLLCLAATGFAQTAITTESFDYPGGILATNNGGTGWLQAWQGGNIALGGGSLVFPGHEAGGLAGTAAGNRLDYSSSLGVDDYSNRRMTTGVDFSQDGTYYSSVLLRKFVDGGSAPGSDQIAVKFFDATLTTQRWGFGLGSTELFYVEAGPDVPAWIASQAGVALNTTYFMVAKLVTRATGNDEWYLNVYGPADTVPGSEPVTWQMSFTGASDATGIDLVRVEYGTNAEGAIDEFRLGTTWASVTTAIPEPSTHAAFAGLAALGWALWRRRRR